MKKSEKALVLLSGGIDSTTCLAIAVDMFGVENVVALSMYYGQKHIKEIESAVSVAEHYGVEHLSLDLTPVFQFSDCALLSQSKEAIPEKSYAEQLEGLDGKPVKTYVPFRNGLFLSCAASVAISKECTIIVYGAHADDAAGNAYPDCSVEFASALNLAIYLGSGSQVQLFAPLIQMNKTEVVERGLKLNAPYELTWSCYEGDDKPCGKCGTCIDRAAAFRANGMEDPAYGNVQRN